MASSAAPSDGDPDFFQIFKSVDDFLLAPIICSSHPVGGHSHVPTRSIARAANILILYGGWNLGSFDYSQVCIAATNAPPSPTYISGLCKARSSKRGDEPEFPLLSVSPLYEEPPSALNPTFAHLRMASVALTFPCPISFFVFIASLYAFREYGAR